MAKSKTKKVKPSKKTHAKKKTSSSKGNRRARTSTGTSSRKTTRKSNTRSQLKKHLDSVPKVNDALIKDQTSTSIEERIEKADLPFSYNETKLVLLVRDPIWLFSYWDFSEETWLLAQNLFKNDGATKTVLRVHNIQQKTFFDVDVQFDSKQWYLELSQPGAQIVVELALIDSQGNFYLLAKSNSVEMPRNKPSDVIDPEWPISDKEFSALYRLSGGGRGFGSSSLESPMRS